MSPDMVPLPGNPTMLRTMADEHLATAESIGNAASALRLLANRIRTRSLAVDVVRDVADDVSDLIVKAEIRYSGTAQALRTYSFALEAAQSRANGAINASASNQSELSTARYYMADAEERAHRDTPERVQAIEDYGRWKQRVRDLEDQIGAAQGEYAGAAADVNDAAQIAISAINDAIERSGLNDSILDRMREAWDALCEVWETYIAPILSLIQEIVGFLAELAGFLAFILAFIPGMQGIAAALLTVALVLHGLSLLLTLVLALSGDRSLGDIIMATLGVVLATIPLAGGAANHIAKLASSSIKEILLDIGKDLLIDVAVGDLALDVDQSIAAFNSGDLGDLPLPGSLGLHPDVTLIIPGFEMGTFGADGDVITINEALAGGAEFIEIMSTFDVRDALVGNPIGLTAFSVATLARAA